MSIPLKGLSILLFDIMMVLSFVFLLRGHNYPGGGFIASLLAISALGVYLFSFNHLPPFFERRLYVLMVLGVLALITSALLAMFWHKALLSGIWLTAKLGTPLLFDCGVYLVLLSSLTLLSKQLDLNVND